MGIIRVNMHRVFGFAILILLVLAARVLAQAPIGFADPQHGYWTRPPQDRFARIKAEIETGKRQLDVGSEKGLLLSLLRELDVPVSSQMLVMSATSLQKGLINPRNPRALYFNDDTYVGFVPRGRIEIASIDPELGGIFYISQRGRNDRLPRIERADNCMTCHAPHYLDEIPGLVIESVVPGMTGGGEKAFRRETSGHAVPLDQRFGGWHVTGAGAFVRHWGNLMMEFTPEGRRERNVQIGELFEPERYPLATSDILPQLLHEHQVGFVNRTVRATYRARGSLRELEAAKGTPRESEVAAKWNAERETLARDLVKYLLFADEAPLPSGGVQGDPQFKADFLARRKTAADGTSLRDFELQTRLFTRRCSYMIYSPSFLGMPAALKEAVFRQLGAALDEGHPMPEFAYLPDAEKRSIRTILKETLTELPPTWGSRFTAAGVE